MTEMHQRGQQPVDEHQLVLRADAHAPLPLPGGKPGLVAHGHNGPISAASSAIT
jgi:hypothetical protein